jgi:hypothetical protein
VQVRKARRRHCVLAVLDLRPLHCGVVGLLAEAGTQPGSFRKKDLLPLVSRLGWRRRLLLGCRRLGRLSEKAVLLSAANSR